MQAQASQLIAGRTEIANQLDAMQKQVNALVTGGFVTDAASGSFQQSYEEFKNGMTRAIEGLDGMANYLNKAANTFQETDAALSRALGN
jgi:WXG100 family type VII secretion target